MATISLAELDGLKTQLNVLINQETGRQILFDIIFRLITLSPLPTPGSPVTVQDARKVILLSETPADKSLWFRVNYALADITLRKEKLLGGSTKDEIRIIRAYANTLTEPNKTNLLNYINKIDETPEVNRFDLPDFQE